MAGSLLALAACVSARETRVASDPSLAMHLASSYLQRGDRAFHDGNLRRARSMFEQALEALPELPEAHVGLGHIAMRERRFADALAEYGRASDGYAELRDGKRSHDVASYHEAQLEVLRLEEAIRVINDPQTRIPEPIRTIKTLELEGRIQQLRNLDTGTEISAEDLAPELDFYVGNALFRLGRLDEAIDSWRSCAERLREFPYVLNNLAVGYMIKGELELAERNLRRARRLGLKVNPALVAELERRQREQGLPGPKPRR